MDITQDKHNKLLILIQQDAWNIESLVDLLRQSSHKRPELLFFTGLAEKISDSLSLASVFKLRDPRPDILSYVMSYRVFNKIETAYYQQIFRPVLYEMMSPENNCIHRISSSNFFKSALMRMVQSRFNTEPHFITFVARLQTQIELKTPQSSS